jgi:hypothetical protein
MEDVTNALFALGKDIKLIDNGLKFRSMGKAALAAGEPIDSPLTLSCFVETDYAQAAAFEILQAAADMNSKEKKAFLYTGDISEASGKIGKLDNIHPITTVLLRTEVETAVEAQKDLIIIDGRSMDKYARIFQDQGLVQFVMGWHFKCDPVIAARRSLQIFGEPDDLSAEQRSALWDEAVRISGRNRSDTLRNVDPLRDPLYPYILDLSTYDQPGSDVLYKRGHDALHHEIAQVDTSYTNAISEMTVPVTAITKFALLHKGYLTHEDVGIKTASFAG